MAGKVIAMYEIKREGSRFDVNNFPWDNGGARPVTYAEIGYDEDGYKVRFVSEEKEQRAEVTEYNGPVHEDSCMELFAAFSEGDQRYINIEVNPKGVAHCEVGSGRGDRLQIDPADIMSLGISANQGDDAWEVSYYISAEFIKKFLPTYKHGEGTVIRANFYKCGDKTGHEHYGCFNNIPWPHPDFHRPEFFAELKLS